MSSHISHIMTIKYYLRDPVWSREPQASLWISSDFTSLNTTVISSTVVHVILSEFLQDSPKTSKGFLLGVILGVILELPFKIISGSSKIISHSSL